MLDFANFLTPDLTRICPNCGESGRPIRYPFMSCEPCDGRGLVAYQDGQRLLDVLDLGRFRVEPTITRPTP